MAVGDLKRRKQSPPHAFFFVACIGINNNFIERKEPKDQL